MNQHKYSYGYIVILIISGFLSYALIIIKHPIEFWNHFSTLIID